MALSDWLAKNWVEIFGAVTGIIYVFLEIKQNLWLWPVGIITSAVYIIVFFTSKFYADMSLQGYYLVISILGWYWWIKGTGQKAEGGGLRAGGKRQGAEGTENGAQGGRRRAEGTGQRAEDTGQRAEDTGEKAEGTGLRAGNSGQKVQDSGGGGDVRLRVTRLRFKTGMILAAVFVIIYFIIWLVLSKLTDSPVPAGDSFITSLSIIATWMLARKIYEHWFLWIIVNSVSSALFIVKGLYPTVVLYLIYLVMSFAGLMEWRKSLKSTWSTVL